jgi:FlaG protein
VTDQANITLSTRSPLVPPRIASAIEAGKMAAQRHHPEPAAQIASASSEPAGPPAIEFLDNRVELHLDKDSGLVVGRVFDRRTNEEVRQIPAETMVRLVAALKKELGPLVDIKA